VQFPTLPLSVKIYSCGALQLKIFCSCSCCVLFNQNVFMGNHCAYWRNVDFIHDSMHDASSIERRAISVGISCNKTNNALERTVRQLTSAAKLLQQAEPAQETAPPVRARLQQQRVSKTMPSNHRNPNSPASYLRPRPPPQLDSLSPAAAICPSRSAHARSTSLAQNAHCTAA
jgi:hypothetical protein